MPDLAVIVPTRGRPENIRKVIGAWDFTNAWDVADLVLVADADDPEIQGYRKLMSEWHDMVPDGVWDPAYLIEIAEWMPMVHKLDTVARMLAGDGRYFALGFAGDDHLPQTINWAQRYLDVLRELGTGMVFGDDGYQGANLSTEWAVTADAVRELGRMVPAPVEHMYCDNSIMDLYDRAGAIRHLPEVRIEHMHPIAGKAKTDAQYDRVNHRNQFKRDRAAYEQWKRDEMDSDALLLRSLRSGQPESRLPREQRQISPGSGPRPVALRAKGPTMARFPFPRHFKKVRAATPPEIGMVLADLAIRVPADQEIVEIGVFQGWTALVMAWGAAQGHGAHITAIDPWDLPGNTYDPPFNEWGSRAWARHNVMTFGYSRGISLVQGFSTEIAEQWVTSPELIGRGLKPVGLLYVDGDHTYQGARDDIEAWAPQMAPDGVIAIDDYGHADFPGVAQAVDSLVAEGFLAPIELFHDRLAVTRLAGKDGPENPGQKPGTASPTAITSEGVEPEPVNTSSLPPEGWVQAEDGSWSDPAGDEFDDAVSSGGPIYVTEEGEIGGVPGKTPIDALNLGQLRTLARVRKIVLGSRKDLKADIIQALKDGK
jgi:hypothetical protein